MDLNVSKVQNDIKNCILKFRMIKIVVDTDIFVDHLRGANKAASFMEKIRKEKFITFFSSLTEAELISGEECKSIEKKYAVLELLSLATKIPVENKIALKAGDFRRNYKISVADAIIAATAFFMKAKLVTRNIKDFKKIKEIEVVSPY